MQLSAILLCSGRPRNGVADAGTTERKRFGSLSNLATLELFGQTVVERVVQRLQDSGVRAIHIICSDSGVRFRHARSVQFTLAETRRDQWRIAEGMVKQFAEQGCGTALVAELGAYAEVDLHCALQFHRSKSQTITPLHDDRGSLSYWIVNAAQGPAPFRFFLPASEDHLLGPSTPYLVQGHVNRLTDAHDFRRLVVDAFLGRCAITPSGCEIRPGVWVEEDARCHKVARLVAPVYVGHGSRLESGAVITRFSNLERNCHVGEGSVLAAASVFPHTVIGRGLDVVSALVDRNDMIHLGRNVAFSIQDPNLVKDAAPHRSYVSRYLAGPGVSQVQAGPVEPAFGPRYLSRAADRVLEAFKGEV